VGVGEAEPFPTYGCLRTDGERELELEPSFSWEVSKSGCPGASFGV